MDQGHSHFDQEDMEKGYDGVASVAWILLVGDAIHNFVDGLSIGAAFTENVFTGISVSLAVICEELPHELGIFLRSTKNLLFDTNQKLILDLHTPMTVIIFLLL